MSKTQIATIRKQLLEGNTITQRSALLDFGIMALPRRIADLKEQGFPVKVEMKTNPHTGQRYASYRMDEEITQLSQLEKGNVYRIYDLRLNPFGPGCFDRSDGYFKPLRDGRPGDNQTMIQMAGTPQVLVEENLSAGHFKIKYIGGME